MFSLMFGLKGFWGGNFYILIGNVWGVWEGLGCLVIVGLLFLYVLFYFLVCHFVYVVLDLFACFF